MGPSTIDVLNRLSEIHSRSLPMYLSYAVPWTSNRRDQDAAKSLKLISDDQKSTADRINELILEEDGTVNSVHFPIYFSGYHDLSLRYLLGKLIELQHLSVQQIQQCVDELALAPRARAIAEEALGAAKAHLQTLQELAQEPVG